MERLEIKHITKKYGKQLALNDVNLTFEKNKIYGLLGRNGAGKTTLINIMTNKIFASNGEILIDNQKIFNNDASLSKIYAMIENDTLEKSMKINKLFYWTKQFYPEFDTEYANQLAYKFGLNTKKKIKQLSTGYRTILKIILTFASNAEILIFDEPILGLDANHRELFYKELIIFYQKRPTTIILSTHLIEEIANIIEEVIIINQGKLLINESIDTLLTKAYTITGNQENIDTYIKNRKVINEEIISKYKIATILEENRDYDLAKELDLEISNIELQKLFIHITSGGEI